MRQELRRERFALAQRIANVSGDSIGSVVEFLDKLVQTAAEELRVRGVFVVPKLIKLRTQSKPPREEGCKIICGRKVCLPPLRERTVVVCSVTRGFAAAFDESAEAAEASAQ